MQLLRRVAISIVFVKIWVYIITRRFFNFWIIFKNTPQNPIFFCLDKNGKVRIKTTKLILFVTLDDLLIYFNSF